MWMPVVSCSSMPDNRILEHAAARGFHSTAISNSRIKIGEGPAGKAALSRERIYIPNLQENEAAT
jgi:hypothetical protein